MDIKKLPQTVTITILLILMRREPERSGYTWEFLEDSERIKLEVLILNAFVLRLGSII